VILTGKDVLQLTGLTGFRNVNHELRKQLLIDLARRHFPPGAALADIGCAAGDLTMELQALGFRMTGVEFEPERLNRAREMAFRLGLEPRFISEDLTSWPLQSEFEGLIMGEVLEHFVEPRAILERHLAVLKAGGRILITVPNMASLRARLKLLFFGEFADHNPEHLFYFTRRRFIEHFRRSPVEIVEITSFLVEVTFSRNRTLARIERGLLAPLKWLVPWCGTHLVVVMRKISPNA
jgi:ubiquinone/menaquinone biosynthesis C-methylase UbiE